MDSNSVKNTFRRNARIKAMKLVASNLVLIALSVVFLIPFGWMVVTSLTTKEMVLAKDRPMYPCQWVTAKVGAEELPVAVLKDARSSRRVVILEEKPTGTRLQPVDKACRSCGEPFTIEPKRLAAGGDLQLVREAKPHFHWKNYRDFITEMTLETPEPVLPRNRLFPWDLGRTRYLFAFFLKNTLTITILCILGQLMSASLVAFGFARLRFPGRNVLFVMVLSTMMLPGQVTMIPSFILFAKLKWVDTLRPLIVPAFFGGGAFFIFLLRQFFLGIPGELEDAARIDGCTTFGIYRNVMLPLSKPALATVAVFSFMSHWNDFMGPLIYTQSMQNKTLALGLYSFKTLYGTEFHLMMAASIVVLLPVLAIFFMAQKYFVKGIVMSGLKG